MRRRFVLRAVKGIGSCQQMSAGCQRMTRSEMADAAPCDDGWLAMGWRVSRGELAGRWLAGSRRMLRRGQRMARSEMADAVQGVARCCAERRQMACGGVARCCAVCCRWFVARRQMARRGSKNAAPEASGWCVEGRRVANRRRSGTIFSPLEL